MRHTACLRLVPFALWLVLGSAAQASDAEDLQRALQRAHKLEARGLVQVTVNFPPRANPVRMAARLPLVAFRLGLLLRNFDVVRANDENIAGRVSTRFDLLPKVGNAAQWSLWVDQAWNIPLAFEERAPDGSVTRRAEFIKVNAKLVAVNLPALALGQRVPVGELLPGLKLPPGFIPVGPTVRPNGNLEISLTDGVNVLALVVSPRNVAAGPGVASRKVGGLFVWLVGNLSQADLGAALSGIRSVDQAMLGTFLSAPPSKE